MKLTPDEIKTVQDQTGATPLPADHPAVPKMSEVFGDHTFYIDKEGLIVFQPVTGGADPGSAVAVRIADWDGPEQKSLQAIEAKATNIVVQLDPSAGGNPDSVN